MTPREQQAVSEALQPRFTRTFFAQRFEDQRHAYDVWGRVSQAPGLAEAALLHDIGKIESDLGAFARSFATVMAGLRTPTSGRWKSYVDHGEIGAEMLVRLGASEIAVAFTRHHPSDPPPGVDERLWHLLKDADG